MPRRLIFVWVFIVGLFAALSGHAAPEGVVWTDARNVTISGSSLTKSGGCDGCGDAGAVSAQSILSGDGFIEFTALETNTTRAAGLNSNNTNTTLADIDFAIHFNGGGAAEVRESGAFKFDTSQISGDVFQVAVEGGRVKYKKNGAVFYTSSASPSYPLIADTSLWESGATIVNAVISGNIAAGGVAPAPSPAPAPAPATTTIPAPTSTTPVSCGLSDSGVKIPPSYTTFVPPSKGGSFNDAVFGCRITRLTDAAAEGTPAITHAYSSVNPFNADSSYVLLQRVDGALSVRDLSGKIVRDKLGAAGILPLSDSFWSRKDPNIIYFHPVGGNTLKSYNVSNGEVGTLRTFSNFGRINFGNGEGDISWDGDRLPILGDGRYTFIYTISSGAISKAVDVGQYGSVDVVDVTPGNKLFLLTFGRAGIFYFTDLASGLLGGVLDLLGETLDLLTSVVAPSADYGGHSDRGQDFDGQDIAVVTNSADPTPIPNCQNGIVKVRLGEKTEECLLPLDWSLAVHVSCNNIGQGWCLVSTYSGNTPSGKWPAYSNELLKVDFNGGVARLAHSRSSNSSYDRIPRAAVSPDGQYVLFDSDMQGAAVDVYLLTVATSAASVVVPPPTPTPVPVPVPPPPVAGGGGGGGGSGSVATSGGVPGGGISGAAPAGAVPLSIAPGAPAAFPAVSVAVFTKTLSRGMRGEDVRQLQEFLTRDKIIYPEGLATGFFGPLTERAVQRLQCRHLNICSGSPASNGHGLVGPRTRRVLNDLYSAAPPQPTPAVQQTGTVSTSTMREIINKLLQEIELLQQKLKAQQSIEN